MPVLVSWSSGKDSAWALHTLRQQPEHYDVRGIFTTVTKTFDRVSIHSTPAWVLKQQSEKLGVPLYEIPKRVNLLMPTTSAPAPVYLEPCVRHSHL